MAEQKYYVLANKKKTMEWGLIGLVTGSLHPSPDEG